MEKDLEPGLPSLTVPRVSVDSSDWEVGEGEPVVERSMERGGTQQSDLFLFVLETNEKEQTDESVCQC